MSSHGIRSYNAIFNLYEGELVAGGNPSCGDVGGTRFFGLLMGQNQHALIAFDTLFKTLEAEGTEIARIIELGTSHGGFSVFLQIYSLLNGIGFTTYDYYNFMPTYQPLFDLLKVDYRQADFLADPSTIEEVGCSVASAGTTILLCDGGDKIREFNTYSRFLKSGDIILAHDYCRDAALFEEKFNRKLWSFCEVKEAEVTVACEEHQLQPYLEEVLSQAAWGCWRKHD